MVWGLLFLSAATIGISTVLGSPTLDTAKPATGGRVAARSSSSLVLTSLGLAVSDSHRMFLSGAVLGIGVSLLLSTLNSYFRIVPSVRVFWRFFANTDETRDLFPYRIPASAADPSSTAVLRTLVNPTMAATAHLHVDYIALPPHYEFPPQKARAVEFYYVISGSGVMSQKGIPKRQALNTGDCCVVDAGNMRWFYNNTTCSQTLVLLRATDGPSGHDRIRKDPNHRDASISSATTALDATTGTAAVIAKGLKALQATATDYYYNHNNNNNGKRYGGQVTNETTAQ